MFSYFSFFLPFLRIWFHRQGSEKSVQLQLAPTLHHQVHLLFLSFLFFVFFNFSYYFLQCCYSHNTVSPSAFAFFLFLNFLLCCYSHNTISQQVHVLLNFHKLSSNATFLLWQICADVCTFKIVKFCLYQSHENVPKTSRFFYDS